MSGLGQSLRAPDHSRPTAYGSLQVMRLKADMLSSRHGCLQSAISNSHGSSFNRRVCALGKASVEPGAVVGSELGTATTVLDALVDEPREEVGPDYELAPFGIKSRRRLCGNCFLDRPTLFLELGDIPADGRQHVVKVCQLGPVADGLAMARNDDCGVVAARLDSVAAIIPSIVPPVE